MPLSLFPRDPITGQDGRASSPWEQWFNVLRAFVNGEASTAEALAATVAALAAAVDALTATVTAADAALSAALAALTVRVEALEETIGASGDLSVNSVTTTDFVSVGTTLVVGSGADIAGLILGQGQIGFFATQNPSADPNTLDDYEEGTFTPVLRFGGASTGITYSTQAGRYTKIGNRVDYSIHLVLTSKGSATGAADITGLPFTAAAHPSAGSLIGTLTGTTQNVIPWTSASTIVTLNQADTGAVGDTNFANNTFLWLSGTYFV